MRSFCIALVLALPLAATALAQTPSVRVHPHRIDFGAMKQHEAKQATITIANDGDGPLTILNLETSCGCTVAELAKDTIAPGDSTVVSVDFNSKEFQGPQTKFVNIYTDDPKFSDIDVMVTADVKVPLYNDPGGRNLGFPDTKAGQTTDIDWTFWTEDADALQMSVQDKPDFLDVAIKNGIEGNPKRSKVTFTVRKDAAPGRHRGTVTLGTNLDAEKTVTIEVAANVVQDLIIGRDRVNFNYVKAGQSLINYVRVGAYDANTKFKLTGAEIDIPGLTASVKNTVPGKEGQAVISGNALPEDDPRLKAANGRMKGTLKIFTDLPSTPVLTIEVSYMVRL